MRSLVGCAVALAAIGSSAETGEVSAQRELRGCAAANIFHDAWIKVAERRCLKCHQSEGDASESEFLLRDASRLPVARRARAHADNCSALTALATTVEEDGRTRLLVKATGGLDHGGGDILTPESTEFELLEAFVESLRESPTAVVDPSSRLDANLQSFFDGVQMISDQRLWRRITLSLAARLPTHDERQAVQSSGLDAIERLLVELMREDAFYQRLLEGFNDIFLTLGYNGNGEDILSYDHFQKTRHWYQKHDLDHVPEAQRQRARYKLADQYREALRREPLELLRYIVQQDRPFTEIVTADYTMVSPYTARGYGVFEALEQQFQDPDDPFEFIPTQLEPLRSRNGKVQPTESGVYPHAGLLSMFQYLRRYPTTETNRNRLRARMIYQHFLGVDIMNLAPRVSDAAAIDAQYEIPTMQAAECVVCHRTIDPIAGLFQDYYNEDGHYGPRKDGWFDDMFVPGCEGVDLPASGRRHALPWLGSQTAADPRFPVAMAEHIYYILMGRRVLLPPGDIDDPQFAARRRAYLAQREVIEAASERFVNANFNLKVLFQHLVVSSHYRADGLGVAVDHPQRRAELEDIGLVRMLGPEQIERKIVAIFGRPWGRLKDSYAILYGGIDSKEVTQRLTEPSGAIGALQRILANDVACKNVAADFALPRDERRLFPNIDPDVLPAEGGTEADRKIRAAVVHLHQHILGRAEQPEVDLTCELFASIVREANSGEPFDPRESYFCKSSGQEGPRDSDSHYTIRSWRAVVTYLLRQPDFLYE
jgi:hypothetical protein